MSKDIEQDIAFIRALAQLLRDTDLAEIEVEREYGEDDELSVRLTRYAAQAPAVAPAPAPPPAAMPVAAAAPAPAPAAEAAAPDLGDAVTSPMVGTVYLAAEPGADPFVQVGDTVSEGQTVLIIEAMKTMNQIPAPKAGTVKAILVSNAEPVEFGTPMILIG
ncbi:MAG: acetyl-CoA carboxylase biotin carboxyl carrier protein [Pseudomonadota bacterium]